MNQAEKNGGKFVALALGLAALIASEPGFAHSRADAIATAAQAFLDTLGEQQRAAAVLPMNTDERATWSNLPIIWSGRPASWSRT